MTDIDVSSICNALVDILVKTEDTTLEKLNLKKGIMHLVDDDRQAEVLKHFANSKPVTELGGSCLNAIRTLASLGSKTHFSGMVGEDAYGKMKPGNRIILRSFNEYLAHKVNLDAWYAAVTLNPDVEFEGALVDRQQPTIDTIMEHMGVTVCHPFVASKKDWIIEQYIKNDIAELLNITRSCEGDNDAYPEVFKGLDYTTYTPGQVVPTCKKCFWCQERQWGVMNAMQK